MSLLIVDDDRGLRETLKEIFETDGYDIETAECGEEAIDIVQRKEIRVLISDYDMPDYNGIELIRVIRKELNLIDMYCLLMTGHSDLDIDEDILDIGIQHMFKKPFELLMLKSYIKELFY